MARLLWYLVTISLPCNTLHNSLMSTLYGSLMLPISQTNASLTLQYDFHGFNMSIVPNPMTLIQHHKPHAKSLSDGFLQQFPTLLYNGFVTLQIVHYLLVCLSCGWIGISCLPHRFPIRINSVQTTTIKQRRIFLPPIRNFIAECSNSKKRKQLKNV